MHISWDHLLGSIKTFFFYLLPPQDLVQEFHHWLSEQREIVKECSDRSGDTQIVERKLQKLKVELITSLLPSSNATAGV